MKRMSSVGCWLGLVLAASLGCDADSGAPPPVGGQSGDDGSGHGGIVGPMDPPSPCEPEETLLDAQASSVFGASTEALLAGLRVGGAAPLFWTPVDTAPETTFSPGPGQSELTIGIERAEGDIVQHIEHPKEAGAACPSTELRVPVNVTLSTADGGIDARFAATLTFNGSKAASLWLQLSPAELGGSFAFEHIGPDSEQWELAGFNLSVSLWPGGSSGWLMPLLGRTDAVVPPSGPTQPSYLTPADGIVPPALPEHWNLVAVWPRREMCNDGRASVAIAADEARIGWSPKDIVAALAAESPWSLALGQDAIRVGLDIETPSGLMCASPNGLALDFDVRATLRAEAAPAGSAVEHLATSTVLRIGARAALDGSGLEELHWERRDVVYSEPRADFEAQAGLALDAPSEYRDLWWSWYGRSTGVDGARSATGGLLVSSLNADQAARVEREVAQGGPGAGVSVDVNGVPTLPGDLLLEADIVP